MEIHHFGSPIIVNVNIQEVCVKWQAATEKRDQLLWNPKSVDSFAREAFHLYQLIAQGMEAGKAHFMLPEVAAWVVFVCVVAAYGLKDKFIEGREYDASPWLALRRLREIPMLTIDELAAQRAFFFEYESSGLVHDEHMRPRFAKAEIVADEVLNRVFALLREDKDASGWKFFERVVESAQRELCYETVDASDDSPARRRQKTGHTAAIAAAAAPAPAPVPAPAAPTATAPTPAARTHSAPAPAAPAAAPAIATAGSPVNEAKDASFKHATDAPDIVSPIRHEPSSQVAVVWSPADAGSAPERRSPTSGGRSGMVTRSQTRAAARAAAPPASPTTTRDLTSALNGTPST